MENQNIQERNRKIREQFVCMVIDKPTFWPKIIEAARIPNETVSVDLIETTDPTTDPTNTDTFALSIDVVNQQRAKIATEPLVREIQTDEEQTKIVDFAHEKLPSEIRILRDINQGWVVGSVYAKKPIRLYIYSPRSGYNSQKLSVEFHKEIDRLFEKPDFKPRNTAVYNGECKKADENRPQDEFLFALAMALRIYMGQQVSDFDTKHLRKAIRSLLLRNALPLDDTIEDVWTHQ